MDRLQHLVGERRRTLRESFADAFDGLRTAMRERNLRIHVFFALAAIGIGAAVGLSSIEWAGLLLVIGMVIRDEIKNSAIERLVDLHSPLSEPTAEERETKSREAKHLAAASVLWGAITSVACGAILLLPKLL